MNSEETTRQIPRVLYLLSHPIQYQAPLLRHIAVGHHIDLHTLYSSPDTSIGYFDAGFGQKVTWDVRLTDGYSHEFLPGWHQSRPASRLTPWSRGLLRSMRSFRPDAVWIHGYDSLNAARMIAIAKASGVPVLARAEVEQSDALGGPLVRCAKDNLLRTAFRSIDGFLAIGKKNRQFYSDRGVPDEKIFHLPYAVDNSRFESAYRDSKILPTLAQEYELPEKDPVFIFSGKLMPRKRPTDVLRALRKLIDLEGISASLLMVGNGELMGVCRDLVERLDLQNRVRFAGFVNQQKIASCYARANGLLLTSERERWGLVANEAMASGCPVISYDSVGCSNDLVVDGENGFVIRKGDISGLARAMKELCILGVRERCSSNAQSTVQKFSFGAIEAGLLDALSVVRK